MLTAVPTVWVSAWLALVIGVTVVVPPSMIGVADVRVERLPFAPSNSVVSMVAVALVPASFPNL